MLRPWLGWLLTMLAAATAAPRAQAQDASPEVDPDRAAVIPVWVDGWMDRFADLVSIRRERMLLVDIGESWTPALFPADHEYAPVFRAIARGEEPPGHHAWRAGRDRYHEVYGIPPTLGLLRERMRRTADLECRLALDLEPIARFAGSAGEHDPRDDAALASRVEQILARAGALGTTDLDLDRRALSASDRRVLEAFRMRALTPAAIRAIQARLACDGHLRGRGFVVGRLDEPTLNALAEFERRHRIYARGSTTGPTLDALRTDPLELDRRAVVRVLVERAMLASGFLEDGSATPLGGEAAPAYQGPDGEMHRVRDLEAEVREAIVSAFGLQDPDSALYWLDSLGDLVPGEPRPVAIPGVPAPDYHTGAMDLEVVIDRGDVWYDFPYDAEHRPIPQPVQQRPTLTVYARDGGQVIPLARFPTTIGGWRVETDRGTEVWRYKESPVGVRHWLQVVSAPVWLPPAAVPPQNLLVQVPGDDGELRWEVNYHLTGPSYASAFGPIAAYHRVPGTREDEGIRTHGTGDYTSMFLGRASSGCHRLQNHLAVRLFSFVLAHRPHRRTGHRAANYRRILEHEGRRHEIRIDRAGYAFDLRQPIPVTVLPGRILGASRRPIETPVPSWPH